MEPSALRYLKRNEIDTVKWDACIEQSPSGRIYAYSMYLDTMSRHWDALVYGDYQLVMPLTWNSKWGIQYLYQPPYTAMLGIFGDISLVPDLGVFLNAIPARYKIIDMDLNPANTFQESQFPLQQRVNYVLSLKEDYAQLRGQYRDTVKRNAKKAMELGCRFETGVDVEIVLGLAAEQLITRKQEDSDGLIRFRKLYEQLQQKGLAECCGVFTPEGNCLASAVFFFSHQRAYYILVGNHPNSKSYGASHMLIDRFIETHAGTNCVLDFEGSDHRNLAFFYSSFGAQPETYPALRLNRLPWPLKWLKR